MEYDLEYILLQQEYRKLHQNKNDIFPKEWYYDKKYDLKKNILKECLDRKCLIKETDNYTTFKENIFN